MTESVDTIIEKPLNKSHEIRHNRNQMDVCVAFVLRINQSQTKKIIAELLNHENIDVGPPGPGGIPICLICGMGEDVYLLRELQNIEGVLALDIVYVEIIEEERA